MSLTPKETEVMDLWDAGLSVAEIVIATGKSRVGVEAITSTYRDEGADFTGNAQLRRASDALGAAIRAAR